MSYEDVSVKQLVINKLTSEQYAEMVKQGLIKDDELYITTDDEEYATLSDLDTKQNVISDLDTIRSGAELGATALQSVPSEYITETELSNYHDSTKQNVISDLDTIRSGAELGATALQSIPSEYVTETELSNYHDSTKQDTLVSGTNIKTINNESILGSGNIEVGGETAESITNQNTESSVKDIKLWQGSETMWNNGEATTWHNYETDVVPIINRYNSSSKELCRIVYFGGKYLSISNQNNKIFSTTNITEIDSWQDTGKGAYYICSGNNMLLCTDTTKTVCKSTDGVNWTPTTQTVTTTGSAVQFCNDRFFLIGGGSAYYSFDGEVWNQVVGGNILSSQGKIFYANGVWVQSRGSSTSYPYSTDGVNWTLKEYDPLVTVNVFASDTKFYLVKSNDDAWMYCDLYESLDALTWNLKKEKAIDIPNKNSMRVSYINGIFFISDYDTDELKISSDLNTFTTTYFSSAYAEVIYDGTKYIASEFSDFWGEYLVIQYDKKNCYLLDTEPTTSSKVYSDKDVQSSLRVTSVSSNSVVLSDGDTYNKNSAGDKFSYRTIGDAHPDYLSFIDNKEVRLGNTTIADKQDSLPSQTGNEGKFLTTNGTTASWAEVKSSGTTFRDWD